MLFAFNGITIGLWALAIALAGWGYRQVPAEQALAARMRVVEVRAERVELAHYYGHHAGHSRPGRRDPAPCRLAYYAFEAPPPGGGRPKRYQGYTHIDQATFDAARRAPQVLRIHYDPLDPARHWEDDELAHRDPTGAAYYFAAFLAVFGTLWGVVRGALNKMRMAATGARTGFGLMRRLFRFVLPPSI